MSDESPRLIRTFVERPNGRGATMELYLPYTAAALARWTAPGRVTQVGRFVVDPEPKKAAPAKKAPAVKRERGKSKIGPLRAWQPPRRKSS